MRILPLEPVNATTFRVIDAGRAPPLAFTGRGGGEDRAGLVGRVLLADCQAAAPHGLVVTQAGRGSLVIPEK